MDSTAELPRVFVKRQRWLCRWVLPYSLWCTDGKTGCIQRGYKFIPSHTHAYTHTESWQSLQGPHAQPWCLPTHHWLWVKNPTSSSKRQEEQGVRTTYTGLGRGQWLPPHQLQCHAEIFKENLHVHVSARTEACVRVCGETLKAPDT